MPGPGRHVLPFHFPADVALQIVDDLAVVARRRSALAGRVAGRGSRWCRAGSREGKVHGAKHGIPGGKARCPMLGRAWLAILTALSAICERLLSLRCQRGRSQVRRKRRLPAAFPALPHSRRAIARPGGRSPGPGRSRRCCDRGCRPGAKRVRRSSAGRPPVSRGRRR